MKSLNILFIHRDLPPDSFTGVAIQVHRLANALIHLQHKVTVRTFSQKPPEAEYHVETLTIPLLFKALASLKRLLLPWTLRSATQGGFDIVHIHGDGAFVNYQSNYIRTFYGTAKMELASSQTLKGKLAQWLSFYFERKENIKIQKHGCAAGISRHISSYLPAVTLVVPCMLPEQSARYINKKTSGPSILYMGSTGSRKRGEWALQLFIVLKKKFPDLTFYFIGNNITKDEEEYFKMPNHLFDKPVFLSGLSQEAINALYAECWIYLSLSSYEGFGVSIIEAMAAKCLVLSTKTPGSESILKEGETGYYINESTAENLISKNLSNHKERGRIVSQAFKYSEQFKPRTIASRYAEIYNSLLKVPI
ncbi:MAG: glycosyltransferase family 4 protein [Fibrobacteria bacterium]|nr:glycosyltransferase family 4 protein [Fibrobacteria bacterium]